MSAVRCVANPHALVGEGPVWDDRRLVLWWIDVKNPRLFCYDPASGENRELAMPERIGCVALRENGDLIGAEGAGDALDGQGVFERVRAEPAEALGNGQPEEAGLVHLAEVLEGKAAGAVDLVRACGNRPRQRFGEGDNAFLAFGFRVIHVVV